MSTKQKITITRALVELKRQDEKAYNLVNQSQAFLAIGDAKRVANTTLEDAEKRIQSDMDQVDAAIARGQAIRNAIHASNAVTKVTLGGKELTVAEAINLKKVTTLKQHHLSRLTQIRQGAVIQAARADEAVEAEINKRIQTLSGKDGKIAENELELIRRNAEASGKATVVGLAKLDAKIKALSDEIEVIISELDFTLSESNARTEIEL